jgi:hypothetical protein
LTLLPASLSLPSEFSCRRQAAQRLDEKYMIMKLDDLLVRAVFLGGCLVAAAFVVIVTRIVVRALVYGRSPPRSRRVPWRFSLMAVTVLGTLAAVNFAMFRDDPFTAVYATCVLLLVWLPIAGFLEFRRELAERRMRELQAVLDESRRRATAKN